MKSTKMLASIAAAALLPSISWAADKLAPPWYDEARTLREEVRMLRLEMRELRKVLAARPEGRGKLDVPPAVKWSFAPSPGDAGAWHPSVFHGRCHP